jgi:FKBP-type peptidyl-prolyl cis-trans isomerase
MLLAALCPSFARAITDAAAADPSARSKAFFEGNAKKEGVVSLPSGLQYRVLEAGEGSRPRAIDTVSLHYRGTTLDGKEVDSSYSGNGPARMRLAQTMPGWREALLLMQEGAKWELFIPAGLGYTRQRGTRYTRAGKLSGEPLIFELELLQVERPDKTSFATVMSRRTQRSSANVPHTYVYLMGEPAPDPDMAQRKDVTPLAITTESLAARTPPDAVPSVREGGSDIAPESGAASSAPATPEAAQEVPAAPAQVAKAAPPAAPAHQATDWFDQAAGEPALVELPNGLKYRVLQQGSGPAPGPGDTVTVHYRGSLLDGSEFDSSYRRGEPARLRLDEAIPGWQALLPDMPTGARWALYIPPGLGYRKPGPLAGQALIFEVELLAVTAAATKGEATQARATGVAPAQQLAVSLPSGLSYRAIRNGGGLSPLAGDSITIGYREKRRADGEAETDGDSYGQATLPLNWLIPAWRSVFTRMEEGASWELQVPPALAYRAWGRRPQAPLALQVELLSVSAAPPEGIALAALEVAQAGGDAESDTRSEEALADLGEGMRYQVVTAGSGDTAGGDDTVTLRYRSTLLDARGFGHLYYGDGQFTRRLDAILPVWQRALGAMRQGSRWRIYVPSERVPAIWAPRAGQTALVEVELLAIEPSAASQ